MRSQPIGSQRCPSGLVCAAALLTIVTSCAGPAATRVPGRSAPNPAPTTSRGPTDDFGKPPLANAAPDATFPTIEHVRLSNGLELRVIPRKAYPLLEARLVVFSGSASDGAQIGVAAMTAELLKVGGAGAWSGPKLIERAESLGSSLDIATGRDSTQISMDVTTADFDRALELMAAVARMPRFAAPEFAKLKQREVQRLKSEAIASAEWAGVMALYRQLFQTPQAAHPYAHVDASPNQLQKVTLPSCKAWYQRNVTPKNATLVVIGDVDTATARAAAEHWFYGWEGSRPPAPVFETPAPPTERMVWLVDRPGSEQSQIYVAGFGPAATSPLWPAADTANQILGGGVAGRLFLDVREKRSLAYHTGSSLIEVAHGRAPLVLSAGTQTAKTDLAVQALLDNLGRITSAAPSSLEVRNAVRNLSTSLLFRTETVSALATLTARLAVLGRPDSYYDAYRQALQNEEATTVFEAAKDTFAFHPPVIVVAGDASRLAPSLSQFGKVEVLDPRNDFAVVDDTPQHEAGSQRPPPSQ
jgi:zinc protease